MVVQEVKFVEPHPHAILRLHHFIKIQRIGTLVVAAYLVEEGTRGDGRCQCNNPHEQQQQPLPYLQRMDEVLHDGIGGNEQGCQQSHKKRHEHIHVALTDGRHVPVKILRDRFGRVNGKQCPEQCEHASGKQC